MQQYKITQQYTNFSDMDDDKLFEQSFLSL